MHGNSCWLSIYSDNAPHARLFAHGCGNENLVDSLGIAGVESAQESTAKRRISKATATAARNA
jgi:hypothetical protein